MFSISPLRTTKPKAADAEMQSPQFIVDIKAEPVDEYEIEQVEVKTEPFAEFNVEGVEVKTEPIEEYNIGRVEVKTEPAEEFEIDSPNVETEELIIKTEYDDHSYYRKPVDVPNLDTIGVLEERDDIITVNASDLIVGDLPICTTVPKSMQSIKCLAEKLEAEATYPCSVCGVNFVSIRSLDRHIKTHVRSILKSSQIPKKCNRCHELLPSKRCYEDHIRSIICEIKNGIFKCDICSITFESDLDLRQHRTLHKLNFFFCRFSCGKYFETVDLCDVHEYAFHKVDEFICSICCDVFPSRQKLFVHNASHSGIKRFVCSYCRAWFKCSIDLTNHWVQNPGSCGKLKMDTTQHSNSTGAEREFFSVNLRKESVYIHSDLVNTVHTDNAKRKPQKEQTVFGTKKLKLRKQLPNISEKSSLGVDVVIKEEPISDHEDFESVLPHSIINGNTIKDERLSDEEDDDDSRLYIKEEEEEFLEVDFEYYKRYGSDISSRSGEESTSTNTMQTHSVSFVDYDDIIMQTTNASSSQATAVDSTPTVTKNVGSKKIKRLRKYEINAIESRPNEIKIVDQLKQQYEKAHELMLSGCDGNSEQVISALINDESSKDAPEPECYVSDDANSRDSVNINESTDGKTNLPVTLYLPVLTEIDTELCEAKRDNPGYRFAWCCPNCPRTYMQKHAFRGHLASAHDLDKSDIIALRIAVKPLPILKSLEDIKQKEKTAPTKENTKDTTTISTEVDAKKYPKCKKSGHTCTKCGRVCSSRTALNDHLMSNCGRDPPYNCPDCEKRFFSASTLNSHRSIHTGALPHKCKYCDKRFRTRGQVTVHHRTHTGEKPFLCKVCGQNFTHRETLIAHLSRHIGMKRYKCYGCNQQFSCISGLKTHREVRQETCGKIRLNPRALGPRVRVIKGNVIFEPQPEINPYLRSEDPKILENDAAAINNS